MISIINTIQGGSHDLDSDKHCGLRRFPQADCLQHHLLTHDQPHEGRKDSSMTVNELIRMAHDTEYICVEDNDFNVYAEGEAMEMRGSKALRGLKVVCFYSAIRSGNRQCTLIVAQK